MKTAIKQLQKLHIKKLSALDKYCIFSLSVLIVYTVISLVYQFVYHEELSSTLTTCVFGAFSGELFMLCQIKRLKLKKGENQ